jgi:hypothetical protein
MHEFDRSNSVGSAQQWVALTRWFHGQNVSWRGTPSELLSQLAKYADDRDPGFADSRELLHFITQNAEDLRRVGIHAAVERPTGRPMRVCLDSVPSGNGQGLKLDPASIESSALQTAAPTDTLQPEGNVDSPEAASDTSSAAVNDHSADSSSSALHESGRRKRFIAPISIAAAILVVGLVLVMIHRGHETSADRNPQPENTVTNPSVLGTANPPNAVPSADGSVPSLADLSLSELIVQAGVSKSPLVEEELATRYMEGRGTQRDVPAAYTWLVLARANGSNRDDELIRKLGNELSQEELQKVRIYLGNSYARGIGVTRNLVTAHSWFELAEVAGSKNATTMKRGLEQSMTPEQIQRAQAKTAEWLARHRAGQNP